MFSTASAVVDAALLDASLTWDLTQRFADGTGLSLAHVIDQMSKEIAERFLRGDVEYWPADYVMNQLWALMCTEDTIPTLAYNVFGAFDAGEYERGDGTDPVEAFVKPALRLALGLD